MVNPDADGLEGKWDKDSTVSQDDQLKIPTDTRLYAVMVRANSYSSRVISSIFLPLRPSYDPKYPSNGVEVSIDLSVFVPAGHDSIVSRVSAITLRGTRFCIRRIARLARLDSRVVDKVLKKTT